MLWAHGLVAPSSLKLEGDRGWGVVVTEGGNSPCCCLASGESCCLSRKRFSLQFISSSWDSIILNTFTSKKVIKSNQEKEGKGLGGC